MTHTKVAANAEPMYTLSRPWIKSFPAKKDPTKKFWVCRVDVTSGICTFSFQFSRMDGCSNWMVKTPVRLSNTMQNKLLNEAMAFIKGSRQLVAQKPASKPVSATIPANTASKEELCL